MNKQTILYLLDRYKTKTATPAEQEEYNRILHDEKYQALLQEVLDEQWDGMTRVEIDQFSFPASQQILESIKQQPRIVRRRLWPRLVAAAAIVLVLCSLGLYYLILKNNSAEEKRYASAIRPGKNGATLTLASGKKILIGALAAGNIASEAGVKISKTRDGQLLYELTEATGSAKNNYNTLSTSRAEQAQVRLPDGTVVFLNAESSLRFPTSMAGAAQREVSLQGEGYFEVAKDKKHPFIVSTTRQKVEVLGTTFNISSYAEEPDVKTTLLEGSVRLSNLSSNATGILKPGEQATVKGTGLEIKPVEVDDAVAWKNGYFMFDHETLSSIMNQVSRWYNVEVVYNDDSMKQKTFFGTVSRFSNVSELLNVLEKTEVASFKVRGRQIVVSEKK